MVVFAVLAFSRNWHFERRGNAGFSVNGVPRRGHADDYAGRARNRRRYFDRNGAGLVRARQAAAGILESRGPVWCEDEFRCTVRIPDKFLILSTSGYRFAGFLQAGIPWIVIPWIGLSIVLPLPYPL